MVLLMFFPASGVRSRQACAELILTRPLSTLDYDRQLRLGFDVWGQDFLPSPSYRCLSAMTLLQRGQHWANIDRLKVGIHESIIRVGGEVRLGI